MRVLYGAALGALFAATVFCIAIITLRIGDESSALVRQRSVGKVSLDSPQPDLPPRDGWAIGEAFWVANGSMNATGRFNQWNSYRDQPANASVGTTIRSSLPWIYRGFFRYKIFAAYSFNCAGTGGYQPCNSSTGIIICPELAIYLSCVNGALNQSIVAANNCAAFSPPPPAGFSTCTLPPYDGINFLLAYGRQNIDLLLTGNQNGAAFGFNSVGDGPDYFDSSQLYNNCSLTVNFWDDCNTRVPPIDYQLSLFSFQAYSVTRNG